MKKFILLFGVCVCTHVLLFAQADREAAVRTREQQEIDAIAKSDTAALVKIWSENFVCNNPYGVIVTIPEIIGFIRKGEIDYERTERVVERVTFTNGIAISMGKEVLEPRNKTPHAGKTVVMRYTHTWMKTNGGWRLIARQASFFPTE